MLFRAMLIGTLLIGPALAGTAAPPADSEWARESYRLNCAPCHGARGEGLDPDSDQYKTFRAPPADFTDPMFTSMEPAADWFLVTKYGGASIGLSSQMPAYDGAFADAQIEALVAHLKTLADTSGYPPGELNFIRPIRTIKAFPENELLLIHRHTEPKEGGDARKSTLYYAQRFGKRQQGEIKLAYLDDDRGSAIDEAELGYKWAFHHHLERTLLLTTGLEAELPIEDDSAPNVYIPYLSFAKGLFETTTLQGTLRSHLPDDGIDRGDLELSAILHWAPSPWPRSLAPALEVTWTAPFTGGVDYETTVIPQTYFGLNKLGNVALAVGVELPLSDQSYDRRIHAFLLWDIADGPFWAGW
ncbi:MAG: cytochrome c [bacterium]|nr:cytochrome c [bacterium]